MHGVSKAPGDAAPLDPADFAAAFRSLPAAPALCLLAVSGGPDSVALMQAAAAWAGQDAANRLAVATVDHALRPASRREAQDVALAAGGLGLRHTTLVWSRPDGMRASQALARRARYGLLCAHAAEIGAACLVTAHTLDDQAETLMIRFAAGSGLSGLGGMRSVTRRGAIPHHRSFLGLPKARLVATCRHEGWTFVEDPSNRNEAFARTRWRRLMPALADEGLDAARLARLAARLQRADDALNAAAERAMERSLVTPGPGPVTPDHGRVTISFRDLVREPGEIALRALCRVLAAVAAGAPMRLDRLETCLEALSTACREGKARRTTLAGCVLTLSADGRLAIIPEPARSRGRARRAALALTVSAATAPHSLGTGSSGA